MRDMTWFVCAVVVAPAVAAPPAFHDAVAGDDPILWYPLNEPAGATTVANAGSLGSAYDASVHGTVTLGVASASGDSAAQFIRTGNPYLESGADAPSSMLGNPTFTAEAVVYIPSSGASTLWTPLLHWGAGGTAQEVYFSLQQNRNNVFYVGFYNGGLRGVCTFRLDDWNHFVWTRDSGGGANNAYTGTHLYVNGEPVALEVDTNLPGFSAPPSVTATPFRVQRGSDFVRHFDGTLDEVALYDHLLSPADVRAHFDALGINDPVHCKADLVAPCGVLDFFDVQRFLQLFASQDPLADLNGDDRYDFFDVQSYLQVFSSGCM